MEEFNVKNFRHVRVLLFRTEAIKELSQPLWSQSSSAGGGTRRYFYSSRWTGGRYCNRLQHNIATLIKLVNKLFGRKRSFSKGDGFGNVVNGSRVLLTENSSLFIIGNNSKHKRCSSTKILNKNGNQCQTTDEI